MLLYVVDADAEETLGEIEVTGGGEVLAALEDSDYIDSAAHCTLLPRPNGEFHVVEDGATILWLSFTDPDDTDDGDTEDEDDDDDEDDEDDSDLSDEDD